MQLLSTKFHIPKFNTVSNIHRKKLTGLINAKSSIVIVSAPAGFGKTTLLSEWVENCKTDIAWVSLEKSEDTPSVFWRYFITSLSAVSENIGQNALELIKSSEIASIENILVSLINEIDNLQAEITLIIDDYHVISDTSIHKGIEFFIDHLPSNMRLIIAGREYPQLPVSKLRLSGRLSEIKAEHLRFDFDETQYLLNTIHSFNLDQNDITSLNNKTEGWIAGIALAVLSIREHRDKKRFINDFTGSHRFIIDYLIEEVLAGLNEETKDFMLNISILERFSPDLCFKITGDASYKKIISSMEKNNLFLIPLDYDRNWFRYHHLFREFLLKNLMGKKGDAVISLHEKAFHWLKENNLETEAFHHGILAEKFEETADLLSEKAPFMFNEANGSLLRHYLKTLPDEVINANPVLCCYNVWLNMLAGDFSAIDLLFTEAFSENRIVQGFISMLNGYKHFNMTGEFDKGVTELYAALDKIPENHFSIREMCEMILCLTLKYSGDIESAYERAVKLAVGESLPALVAINYADILIDMGEIDTALSVINTNIEDGKLKCGENLTPEYCYHYILKGSILREKNQIPEALKTCRQGLFLGRNEEYVEFVFLANMEYGRVLAADNNYDEAEKAINHGIEAAKIISSWGATLVTAHKIRIEIQRGNLSGAKKLLDAIGDFSENEIPFHKHNEYLSFCRYCLAVKDTNRVHEITDYMIKEDFNTKRKKRLLEAYVLKALAYKTDNKTENALNTISKAFKIAEKNGDVRIFIDEGEMMNQLFHAAHKKNLLPEYLKHYLNKTDKNVTDKTIIVNEFKESFNEREIEILQLMKKGASNKIIADTLFISVNTVRWYASRIFAKLGVKRRGEAVSCAVQYKLI